MTSSSSQPPAPAVTAGGALFDGLVDDAGLFPPEELPMTRAVIRHRRDQAAGSRVLSGRFICPGLRLDELRAHLQHRDRFAVSVITALVPAAVAGVTATIDRDERLTLAAVEAVLPADWAVNRSRVAAVTGELPSGVITYLEIPLVAGTAAAVDFLGEQGLSAKIRCGGVRANLFPGADQLAAAIGLCVRAGVSFKATAGLHHAVRNHDPLTGFTHHGFLNILVAVARAIDGAPHDGLVQALQSTDPDALVTEIRTVQNSGITPRAVFHSYGSCSTADPIDDLTALHLLRPAAG